MSNVTKVWRAVGVVALAALAALSCKGARDGIGPAGDYGSVTSAEQGTAATTPAQLPTSRARARILPAPRNAAPETAPAPQIEMPTIARSPAVMEAVNTAEGRLAGLTNVVRGTKVRFVDCREAASCTTRLEATSLAGLRDLLQAISKDQGGIGFVAREQLDAYTGQKFVADVTMGSGAAIRPVPADENELLVNDEAP
jgi:hypothetical protein